MESQTCAVGGWGPMFGTKSQKKTFFLTPSLITVITCRAQTERVEEMKENFRYFLRDRKVKVEEEIEKEKERLAEENGLNNLEMSIKKAKNCFGPALVCTNCESRGSSRKPMIECSR